MASDVAWQALRQAKEVLRQAEADGLTPQANDNTAGFTAAADVPRDLHSLSDPQPICSFDGRPSRMKPPKRARLPELTSVAATAAAPAPLLTAEESLRQAGAEGLTLQPSDNKAGFKGVSFNGRAQLKPFFARVKRGGKKVHLGTFATAEAAALCYARDIVTNGAPTLTGVAATAAAPMPLTAEEALRQAEDEGLTLQPRDGKAAFKGVSFHTGSKSRPYVARVKRGGKSVHLGYFATAQEAALCYTRDIVTNGAPTLTGVAATAAAPMPLTAEEALRQAEDEGLTLQPRDGKAAFKGVSFHTGSKSRPYVARVKRGGKSVHLGYFATAEEAALCYARDAAAANGQAQRASDAGFGRDDRVYVERLEGDVWVKHFGSIAGSADTDGDAYHVQFDSEGAIQGSCIHRIDVESEPPKP